MKMYNNIAISKTIFVLVSQNQVEEINTAALSWWWDNQTFSYIWENVEYDCRLIEYGRTWAFTKEELEPENMHQTMSWIQKRDRFYCSNCNNDEMYKTPFCPQCGAKYVAE